MLTDRHAVIRYDRGGPMWLHLVLLPATFGAWALVWLVMYWSGHYRKERLLLTVDSKGHVSVTTVPY
jgi:hypothetical protein